MSKSSKMALMMFQITFSFVLILSITTSSLIVNALSYDNYNREEIEELLSRIRNNLNNNQDYMPPTKYPLNMDDYYYLLNGPTSLQRSLLSEQSIPFLSSQIKRDFSKKQKSRDILRGLAVKRNEIINPLPQSSSSSSYQIKENKY